MIIPLALVVFLGALAQRVSGLGFALLAAPLLVLLAGPYQGIVLANLLALLVSTTVLATTWRHVEVNKALLLVPAGIAGVVPGVLVARHLPAGPLQVAIGAIILIGLTATLTGPKLRLNPGTASTLLAGATSGFMTATAGVGGPALSFYAVTTSWTHTAFAATAQISFATQAALALGIKGITQLPPPPQLAALVAAVAAGLGLGHILADRIPAAQARRMMIFIALGGSVATMIKGFTAW